MSKYDKTTKFYWLQLKEDFFEDDAISWLEEQKPNGKEYALFYLKLCLKSLKSNGVLIRKVGKILIPYDNYKLAELTRTDFDTVVIAMELLKQIGLIQILENGEIYINQLEDLIGSKSKGALLKQQKRIIGGQKADICPPKIEIELDIDIDKDIELDINKDLLLNKSSKQNIDYQLIQNVFNNNCTNLPKIQKITDKRKIAIRKFLKEFSLEEFENICKITNNTDFLIGKNKEGWKADFDFLLRTDKATNILEGKYGNLKRLTAEEEFLND